ncbi:caspase family protein [Jeongeupia wiesaeckerbachi]|uniref:caspase family protein n=1 Tax=Jeongeupia wiesaeckerbachi TaxID=3051218 RepID=UPI003D8093B4
MHKSALCVGINDYPGVSSDLAGCVNDAKDWAAELQQRGFAVSLLLDGDASKQAMVDAIRQHVDAARANDVVVITYSGHGSWVPDDDGDEPDARDEVLCPHDIHQGRTLSDDELYALFDERERGVRIVLIADSCHSGTVAKAPPPLGDDDRGRTRFLAPETFLTGAALAKAQSRATAPAKPPRPAGGVLMAGCRDTEFSYDARFNGKPNGAFSYVALQALKRSPATYRDWFTTIRQSLPSQNYPQTPQLGGTRAQQGWPVFN